jgi:HEPN domain-containing protein
MSDPERTRAVAKEWVAKAEADLTSAAHLLTLGAKCPTDAACFHAQQCVEKYLKALLVLRGIAFPKTHNVRLLMGLVPAALRPALDVASQDRLTEYATVTRYPGDYEAISLSEARRAVALARRVKRGLRRHLSAAVPRRKKR